MIVLAKTAYHAPFTSHLNETAFEIAKCNANTKFAEVVNSDLFAYARFRPNFGVTAYINDKKSPTGVVAGATAFDLEDAVAILDAAGRPFPYSPTEGLNKSGVTAVN